NTPPRPASAGKKDRLSPCPVSPATGSTPTRTPQWRATGVRSLPPLGGYKVRHQPPRQTASERSISARFLSPDRTPRPREPPGAADRRSTPLTWLLVARPSALTGLGGRLRSDAGHDLSTPAR